VPVTDAPLVLEPGKSRTKESPRMAANPGAVRFRPYRAKMVYTLTLSTTTANRHGDTRAATQGGASPETVEAVLDRLAVRDGELLVVIEGAARGADQAAHLWCERHGLPEDRHRCHPVDWRAKRQARLQRWPLAGPERNSRMLLQDRPRLIICFHDHLDPASGETSDMALRGLLRDVPVWLVPCEDPAVGRWLSLDLFPHQRASRIRRELDAAALPH
jgi:hypothetical protein